MTSIEGEGVKETEFDAEFDAVTLVTVIVPSLDGDLDAVEHGEYVLSTDLLTLPVKNEEYDWETLAQALLDAVLYTDAVLCGVLLPELLMV